MSVASQTDAADMSARPRRRLSQFFHPFARAGGGHRQAAALHGSRRTHRGVQGLPRAACGIQGRVHTSRDPAISWLARRRQSRVCLPTAGPTDRTGKCVRIPALPDNRGIPGKARAIRYHTGEAYGLVWAALDEPVAPIPGFPNDEWHNPAWRGFLSVVETWHSSAGRILENFCDWAHLPWVHENLLGTRDRPEVQAHNVSGDRPSTRIYDRAGRGARSRRCDRTGAP